MITLKTEHEQTLYRMAYNAKRDGYEDDWHRFFARTHRDRAILDQAVKRAVNDQLEDERKHAEANP